MSEIRQHNLKQIADSFESQQKLADILDFTAGYVNQLLTGHRNIGEKAARKIEQKLKLNHLALDNNISTELAITQTNGKQTAYDMQAFPNQVVLEQKNHYLLNKDEIELLDLFKWLTGEQKQLVLNDMREIARKNEQIIKELKK